MNGGGRSRRVRLATFALLLPVFAAVGLAAGCKGRPPAPEPPPRPWLQSVTVEDATRDADRPATLDLEAVKATAAARLRATGLFAPQSPDGGAAAPMVRARCEVAIEGAEVEDKGVARALVRVRLETRPSGAPGAIDEDLRAKGERIYSLPKAAPGGRRSAKEAAAGEAPALDKDALFTKLVASVAGDLIDGFAARERLHAATPAEIHAAIGGDGGELREEAIRIAGERKLTAEVPTLLGLLEDPTESVRDAALGALIAIGDQRAVTALAKSRSFHDYREMRKILEAMAMLGGDEALDYLGFVAESHDDPEIRDLAKAAKLRLERRRASPKPGVAGQ